jgi:hypothetical protein
MQNRNIVVAVTLGTLLVAGSLWAADRGNSLPFVKRTAADKMVRPGTSTSLEQQIIDSVDHYAPTRAGRERAYHAKVTNPNIPWADKVTLAMEHNRLHLLSSDAGGILGGDRETGRSMLSVRMTANDRVYASFEMPASFEVHTAPHPSEVGEMSFDTEMYSIEGEATKVEGFDSIRLVGGTGNGYKSPGHTSLIPAGDDVYAVDSTFNISYRIEYVGAKGGPLEGLSGTIESSILMKAVGK